MANVRSLSELLAEVSRLEPLSLHTAWAREELAEVRREILIFHGMEFERDPGFYSQDIYCACADMAKRFGRDEFIKAVMDALQPHGFGIVDLKEMQNAA